jgi:hypothetical protein
MDCRVKPGNDDRGWVGGLERGDRQLMPSRLETLLKRAKPTTVVMPWLDHGIHTVTLAVATPVTEWLAGSLGNGDG